MKSPSRRLAPLFPSAAAFRASLERRAGAEDDRREKIAARTGEIIERVRKDGDRALVELAARFDGVEMTEAEIRIPPDELDRLADAADPEAVALLARAFERITAFHERQREPGFVVAEADGSRAEWRVLPLASVGVYVPGGAAAYPSSVLMNVAPARVAGAPRVALATPPGALERSPALAAAVRLAGVSEAYRMGGAQAIAAFAFGTETVRPVRKVVGPGNAYVAEAKSRLRGVVGADAVAGPSEIVIVADAGARPDWIAADLLAQAEHGSGDERAILLTPSAALAEATSGELRRQNRDQPHRIAIARALGRGGALVVTESLDEAVEIAEWLAPEHVEILTARPGEVADRLPSAGAILLGGHAPAAIGDYGAGPNHVLPTGGAARFASPLSVADFRKRQSVLAYSRDRLADERADFERFARVEGFEAHARSVAIRFSGSDGREDGGAAGRPPEPAARPVPLHAVRAEIRGLSPEPVTRRPVPLQLNWNESRWPLPEGMEAAVEAALRDTDPRPYPDVEYGALTRAIGEMSDWDPDGILFGNGGDDMLGLAALAFSGEGASVMFPTPGFAMYPWAAGIAGASPRPYRLGPDLGYDFGVIETRLRSARPPLAIITAPHNPTGEAVPPDRLRRLAAAAPGFLLIDEAYREFSGRTARPLLDEFGNVILLRTFSKAMAMAGARLGFLLLAPEAANEARRVQAPFPVSSFTCRAARAAMEHRGSLLELVERIVKEREALTDRLNRIPGVSALRSSTNFVLFRTGVDAPALAGRLLERGVAVREYPGEPLLRDALRVTVGTPDENRRFLEALSASLASSGDS